MKRYWRGALVALLGALSMLSGVVWAEDEYERAPIEYSKGTPDNAVSKLATALASGEKSLTLDEKFGYLPDLLKQLDVPVESQMLVFSKTSLQRSRIAPRTPRALYFNDDVYVGYCHHGDKLEISAADPQLGAVFYTIDQTDTLKAEIVRQTQDCLQCHGTSQTDNIPGHTIRSLFVDVSGMPIYNEGSRVVDHATPIEQRWGGWYVTGAHAGRTHQGNLIVRDRSAEKPWINSSGQNLTDLTKFFNTSNYPTPHSDIVALLVFEHQTYVHNLLTKASYTARQALHYEAEMNRALGEPPTNRFDSVGRRIANAAEDLVEGLLFSGEAPLQSQFVGTSGFTELFAQRGPRDKQGRSLRDFDLKARIFKYPCSYLIYSPAFDGLHPEMKLAVAKKLRSVLDGQGGKAFEHLTAEDRQAINEILTETKPELWDGLE